MIPSTLKTIFIDSDLDDSSVLLDVQHPYRDKDLLLTNHFDDVEDDVHDQVRPKEKKPTNYINYLSILAVFFLLSFCFCCFCQHVPVVMHVYVMQSS